MSWRDHRIPMTAASSRPSRFRRRVATTWRTPPAGYEDELADIERFLSA